MVAPSHADSTVAKKSKTPDFEQALHELEGIVERMEKGDLSLEESLQQFERGVNLSRSCQQSLQAAEQKVQILLQKNANAAPSDFEPNTDAQADA